MPIETELTLLKACFAASGKFNVGEVISNIFLFSAYYVTLMTMKHYHGLYIAYSLKSIKPSVTDLTLLLLASRVTLQMLP